MRFIIGGILLKSTFLLMVLMTSNYNMWGIFAFIDMPTIIFILVVNASVLIATGQFKLFIKAANAIIFKNYVLSNTNKEQAINMFKLLVKTTNYAAALNFFAATVLILSLLDDLNALGPMFSIALISVVCAIVINLIFNLPAIEILKTRKNPDEKETLIISEKLVINKMLEMCYKQGITPEDVLNAEEIYFKNHEE